MYTSVELAVSYTNLVSGLTETLQINYYYYYYYMTHSWLQEKVDSWRLHLPIYLCQNL
jgi:hypothetical protein